MTPLISKSLRLLGTLVLGTALHTLAAPFAATDAEAACVSGVASNDVLNIRNTAPAAATTLSASSGQESAVS